MPPQILDRALGAYRIGNPDGAFPIFDATGSKLYPGRWNRPTSPVLYCSEHHSTVMLEKLVHGGGRLPPNQHHIGITVPNGVSYGVLTPAQLPGWDHPSREASRAWGHNWQRARRSLLLLVPSVVARMERNVLLNPEHPEFGRLVHGLHEPVWWDRRLFG